MSISTITGHVALAEVRFGSNGDPNGSDAEYRVGDGNGTWSDGRRTWDSDLSDGLNSGNVGTVFTANPGGGTNGLAWSVIGGVTDPLSFSAVTYGNIDHLILRAAVTGPGMRVRWSGIIVDFYRNGALRQRKSYASWLWPDANTLSMSQSDPVEKTLTLAPSATDNDKVIVTASVLLQTDSGVYPSADALFGQIFLFA